MYVGKNFNMKFGNFCNAVSISVIPEPYTSVILQYMYMKAGTICSLPFAPFLELSFYASAQNIYILGEADER